MHPASPEFVQKLARAPLAPRAAEYFRKRKIDPEYAAAFGAIGGLSLRFSSNALRDMSAEDRTAALTIEHFTHTTQAIGYPLMSLSGEVLGFLFRGIEEKKFIHVMTAYGKYYQPLFGAYQQIARILSGRTVVLVEGVEDMLSLQGCPFPVLAVQTSSMSPRKVSWLSLLVKRVILMLDNDNPGVAGARKTQNALESREIEVTTQPYDGHDPNDYLMRYGEGARARLFTRMSGLDTSWVKEALDEFR